MESRKEDDMRRKLNWVLGLTTVVLGLSYAGNIQATPASMLSGFTRCGVFCSITS